MRKNCAGVLFFSDFDSGNLERVESVENFLNESIVSDISSNRVPSGHVVSSARCAKPKRFDNTISDICKQLNVRGVVATEPCKRTRQPHILNCCPFLETAGDVSEAPFKEFRIWTRPDCSDTAFENSNRSWFYFGVESETDALLRLHVMNLNKQSKLMAQGMTPVVKVKGPMRETESLGISDDKVHLETWRRIESVPSYQEDGKNFVLSFEQPVYRGLTTYLAFTYPFSYGQLQDQIAILERKFPACLNWRAHDPGGFPDDIYYCCQLACRSVGGHRVDLLTVTSRKGLSELREETLMHLFPDTSTPRCHTFVGKKVVFVSARVHPGETQSSFVMNGFLKFITSKSDPRAAALRDLYVFKLMPMLNPDGVLQGHYRTDLAGINLNRMYLTADLELHPSIFAARSLLLYYHQLYMCKGERRASPVQLMDNVNALLRDRARLNAVPTKCQTQPRHGQVRRNSFNNRSTIVEKLSVNPTPSVGESGIAFYLDLHGHASKRGCFLYGNHFPKLQDKVESLLFAKAMSINFAHFDFLACNFTEQNMYQRDTRDGLSKEGSGRVALHMLTGLLHSYTFECNFNTGRAVNVVPSVPVDQQESHSQKYHPAKGPPKYTPQIFEEAGAALAVSMLDLSGVNPISRLPLTPHRSLDGLRNWIYQHLGGEMAVPSVGARRQHHVPKNWGSLATTVAAASYLFQKKQPTTVRCLRGGPLVPPSPSGVNSRSLRIPIWAPCRTLHTQPHHTEIKQQPDRPVFGPMKGGAWPRVHGAIAGMKQPQVKDRQLMPRSRKEALLVTSDKVTDTAIAIVGKRLATSK